MASVGGGGGGGGGERERETTIISRFSHGGFEVLACPARIVWFVDLLSFLLLFRVRCVVGLRF